MLLVHYCTKRIKGDTTMKLFNKLIEKIKECIQGYLLYRMFEKDGQVKIVESEEKEND